jgi:hypothetical protein
MNHQTKMAVIITGVAILFILCLAFYGYLTGAWITE